MDKKLSGREWVLEEGTTEKQLMHRIFWYSKNNNCATGDEQLAKEYYEQHMLTN